MSGEFLTDVRDQLASKATQTSISELQQRGMSRVRVIRSSTVMKLIQDAVDRALADRGLDTPEGEREGIVEASQEILTGLMSQQTEMEAQRAEMEAVLNDYRAQLAERDQESSILRDELDKARADARATEQQDQELSDLRAQLDASQTELTTLRSADEDRESEVEQLRDALATRSDELAQMRAGEDQQTQETSDLKSALEEKDLELQEARSKAAELNAELQVMQKRSEAASPDALMAELKALRTELQSAPAGGGGGGGGEGGEELQARLSDLGRELGDELARIGRKVGIAPTEEADSDLSALFNDTPDLESNMDTLDTDESKGSDVDEALARMRRLRSKT